MMSALDVLEHARIIFENQGGAIGELRNSSNQVCAIGAIEEVYIQHNHQHKRETSPLLDLGWVTAAVNARAILNKSAYALFGSNTALVNDKLGHQAILDVYDHAIKTLKG